jgi:3-oxoacyl-[acyl-carrier protein] reductase
MKLKGKVALVTGGASGLGEATAEHFANEGAVVVVADQNMEGADRIAAKLAASGATTFAIHVDVAEAKQIEDCVAKVIARFGQIDILFNSAGIARLRPFLETSVEDFDLVHKINVRGTFLMGQQVARTMLGRGGNIINVASASGRRGNYGRTAYGTGKAAIIMMTEIMAVELAAHNIRVNVIAPGPIETPIVAPQLTEAGRKTWTSVVPMNRWGRPAEIASAAVFLASEDSSFITGHCLDVDGGFFAGGILKP